jgi:phosphate starvation-inducible PhoH-like protein
MRTITLDARVIRSISGHYEEALRLIEDRFHVKLAARGSEVSVTHDGNGAPERVGEVVALLEDLARLHDRGMQLSRTELKTAIGLKQREPDTKLVQHFVDARIETPSRKTIVGRSRNQRLYIEAIRDNDLVFGIGPAGTGKTYLAVAMAVSLLDKKKVKRIILTRPAVEAGENLGFLPGDVSAKVDPYLRPLYDALYDMLEPDRAERLLEQGTIEVAPLAFMRGRTLDHSVMILDEAQNTTSEQMKMFLTRIGFGSKAVVTGDVTQIDLPAQKTSGLVEARQIVHDICGIQIIEFDEKDVVRHALVQRIVRAYDQHQRPDNSHTARSTPPEDGAAPVR